MKVFQLMLNALLACSASAGWIYPSKSWRSVSQTLPGATFRKRDVAPPSARLAERGGGGGGGGGGKDLWQACSTANLASKYNKYPINGLSVGGAQIGAYNLDNSPTPIGAYYSPATSAYDCCVQAQQRSDSAVFYYSSSPQQCLVVSTDYCQYPNTVAVIFGASYNGSEARGTTYGNYLGNGRCGPGYTVAINTGVSGFNCASASSFGSTNFTGAASSASSCFSNPGSPDLGGATPAG